MERGLEVVSVDLEEADRRLDVTDPVAMAKLAEELRPVIWVNNAGLLESGDAIDQPDEVLRDLVDVNVLGVMYGTRAAVKAMRKGPGGYVLNIGSLAAWAPTPGLAVYGATKHAVRAYTASVAAEIYGEPIRLCALCPDGIWTPMLQRVVGDPHAASPFSASRLLEPDHVAEVGVRLLLDERRAVRSIPPSRAVFSVLAGLAPGPTRRLWPLVNRKGKSHQRRLVGSALGRSAVAEVVSLDGRGGALTRTAPLDGREMSEGRWPQVTADRTHEG